MLQSWREWPAGGWRLRCLSSVRRWAAARGHAWRFIGDELFAPVPDAARAGCRGETLPMTDLGRLLWMRRLHDEGWRRVIWLDADILVIDPALAVEGEGIGREAWIARGAAGGFRAVKGVNNCALSFAAGSPLLARYLGAALDAAAGFTRRPHPRALGPDLLLRLHRRAAFPLFDDIAMLSPLVGEGLAKGDGRAAAAHAAVWGGPVRAANLCGSLGAYAVLDRAAAALERRSGPKPPAAAPDVEIMTEAKGAPSPW